jgi:pimeloyl-ACP methyl ester carboxylesterase
MQTRPVLVIWGKQDPSVPFEASGPLLETLPRARLVTVEDSGHLPQWEQPAITHAALLEFLRTLK